MNCSAGGSPCASTITGCCGCWMAVAAPPTAASLSASAVREPNVVAAAVTSDMNMNCRRSMPLRSSAASACGRRADCKSSRRSVGLSTVSSELGCPNLWSAASGRHTGRVPGAYLLKYRLRVRRREMETLDRVQTAELEAADTLGLRYAAVRAQTEALCAPLETEDYVVSTMSDVSPTKWHLAHTSWFFETFALAPFDPAYVPLNPR